MITLDGKITKALPNGKYVVEVQHKDKTKEFLCHVSGKIRLHHIIIIEGDKVKIEVSPYDTKQGKIIYRYR